MSNKVTHKYTIMTQVECFKSGSGEEENQSQPPPNYHKEHPAYNTNMHATCTYCTQREYTHEDRMESMNK